MEILVDADACPGAIKEILYKAVKRTGVAATLVANSTIRIPPSALITMVRVSAGPDVADDEIIKRMKPGDLVITADIPLAARVIDKGGHALNPRGKLYTSEDIGTYLSMRDFMDVLRQSGVDTGGPAALSKQDRNSFANELDRFLTRHHG